MAETFLKAIGGERFEVESAGLITSAFGVPWPRVEGKKLLLRFKKISKHNVFLSEATGDIIFGLFFPGIGEHSLGIIKFNEFTYI
jgi:hypothetical protein